jgi:hypothetical protein
MPPGIIFARDLSNTIKPLPLPLSGQITLGAIVGHTSGVAAVLI